MIYVTELSRFPHVSAISRESHQQGGGCVFDCTSLLHGLSTKPDEARDGAPLSLAEHLQAATKHLIWRVTTDGHKHTYKHTFYVGSDVFFFSQITVPTHDVRAPSSSQSSDTFTVHYRRKKTKTQKRCKLTLYDATALMCCTVCTVGAKRKSHATPVRHSVTPLNCCVIRLGLSLIRTAMNLMRRWEVKSV